MALDTSRNTQSHGIRCLWAQLDPIPRFRWGWTKENGATSALQAFHSNPLVLSEQDGDALRHAALVFHSRVQQQRYSTGNTFRTQQQQVEYLVDAEHAHLLAPFTASVTL